MEVSIGFDLAANGVGNWFTLDDATKGALNNATYTLSGEVLVDVTDDVRSVTIRRGRSRTLQKFTAGNATVVLDNRAANGAKYDPTNTSSPYYGSVVPGKQITITRDGIVLYVGNTADWNYSYDVNGDAVAEPSAVDGLAYLAQQTLSAGTATSQLTGDRVTTILNAVGWPVTQRSISAGQATLDADVVAEGTNALAYLEKVADVSEPGAVFIDASGLVAFRDRTDLQDASVSSVAFGGTGIPYQSCEVVYGTEEMTNAVSVTYTAGSVVAGTAVATDAVSQTAYGVIDASYETVLSNLAQAQALADWQVGIYAQPRYRVDSISVNLGGLSSTDVATVLALDLGSIISVTPPNASSVQVVTIDGIEHSANPGEHVVGFRMSETTAAFVLDSSAFGVLDSNVLGF